MSFTAGYTKLGQFGSIVLFAVTSVSGPLAAQDDVVASLEHRFADVGDLRLEYFEFGDAGTPIVLIQDHHDYFHEVFGPEEADELREWVGFLEELGQNHRVITPVRRGWGESDDPGYGYDVPTQAEDVLALMDWLGLVDAIFVGRTAATQEMTWIAEHHPDRVRALAYWGTPIGHSPERDPTPEVTRFGEMYNRRACDVGDGRGDAIDEGFSEQRVGAYRRKTPGRKTHQPKARPESDRKERG